MKFCNESTVKSELCFKLFHLNTSTFLNLVPRVFRLPTPKGATCQFVFLPSVPLGWGDERPWERGCTFLDTLGGRIHFKSKYTCVSENVAYGIKCPAGHKIYIGETGRRLGDRVREHLRSTRLPDSDLPVGRQFASSCHTTQDMLVSVIRSGFRDATDRHSFEARMIFRHRTLHRDSLNVDFSFI